jgi:hypothetical protein
VVISVQVSNLAEKDSTIPHLQPLCAKSGRSRMSVWMRKPKKTASGQREMPMAISSKGEGKSESKSKGAPKETKRPARQRKAR